MALNGLFVFSCCSNVCCFYFYGSKWLTNAEKRRPAGVKGFSMIKLAVCVQVSKYTTYP